MCGVCWYVSVTPPLDSGGLHFQEDESHHEALRGHWFVCRLRLLLKSQGSTACASECGRICIELQVH